MAIKNKKQLAKEVSELIGFQGELDDSKIPKQFLLDVKRAVNDTALNQIKEDIRTLLKLGMRIPMSMEEINDAIIRINK
jgi:hypothetical protein